MHLLDVVQLLQRIQEPEELVRVLAGHGHLVGRDHGQLRLLDRQARGAHPFLHRVEVAGFGGHHELVPVPGDVLGSRLDGGLVDLELGMGGGVHEDLPLPLELPRHGPAGSQAAVVLAQAVPEIGHGTVLVVGEGLDVERHAAGPVPLVGDLLVVHALELARPLLDGPLDVLQGHRGRLGRVDGEAETGVEVGIPSTLPGGHGDLPDQLGELRSALGVVHRLLALDLGPFAVAGHASSRVRRVGLKETGQS